MLRVESGAEREAQLQAELDKLDKWLASFANDNGASEIPSWLEAFRTLRTREAEARKVLEQHVAKEIR